MTAYRAILRTVLASCFAVLGSWTAQAATVIPSGSTMTVPGVALDLACTDLLVQGTLNVGLAQINQSTTVTIAGGGLLSAGQGTINVGGDWNNSGSFIAGTSTVVLSDICGNPTGQLSGNTTFYNLTLTSSLGKQFIFPAGTNIVVTGTLTLQGVPGNPIRLLSPSGQNINITLAPGAQLIISNAQLGPNVTLTVNTTPDAFSFIAQTGAALNSVATSNTITVAGINSASAISIVGGTYSIGGGAYVSTPGSVNNGDTVTVRQTASASYNTLTTATLTIGGVSGAFNVTTQAAPVGSSEPNSIPTLNEYGLTVLAFLMAIMAFVFMPHPCSPRPRRNQR